MKPGVRPTINKNETILKTITMTKSLFRLVCCFAVIFTLFSGAALAQNSYIKTCLEAIDYEKQGRLDDAVAKYTEAINSKPDEWTGYIYRAKVNLNRDRLDDAITDASKAISLSPQSLSSYVVRANCLEAKGQYDKAIVDYSVALSKISNNNKENDLTYFQRGRAYFHNKQFQESVDDFTQSLLWAGKLGKPTEEIHYMRAQAYLELKKYSEAITDIEPYLVSNPDNLKALLLQGSAYLKIRETDKARATAQKILRLDPTKEVFFSGSSMTDLFNLEMRRKKAAQLTKEAQTLISERSSTSSKTLTAIKLTDAFKDLDTAWLYCPGLTAEDRILRDTIRQNFFFIYPLLKTKPEISEQVRKFMVQAATATKEKKYDEAIALWTTTLDVAPYTPVAYYNRALLYEMKELYSAGISDMENYLKLMPDATDARSSKDKIYAWEAKSGNETESIPAYQAGAINYIQSESYSPGNFVFAMAVGGGFGVQFAKNPGLEDLWTSCTNGATPDFEYTDKMPFLYSADLELVVKPVKRIAVGAFGKLTGGIGARTKVGDVKYMLNMGSAQYGGLVRFYMLLNDGAAKPDLYIQLAYGQSKLNGYYGVATMDGLYYDYSYMKKFKGSAPYKSAGLGVGGKISKHGYLTFSLDYLSSEINDLTWEVSTNKGNSGDEGSTGTISDVKANYNGALLKLMFGFCF